MQCQNDVVVWDIGSEFRDLSSYDLKFCCEEQPKSNIRIVIFVYVHKASHAIIIPRIF